jgi:hypothetical protein
MPDAMRPLTEYGGYTPIMFTYSYILSVYQDP